MQTDITRVIRIKYCQKQCCIQMTVMFHSNATVKGKTSKSL